MTIINNIGELVGIVPKGVPRKRGAEMDEVGSLKNAYLTIKGERIAGFGNMSECPAAGPDDEVIDAGGGLVMPAFCDSHTHTLAYEHGRGVRKSRKKAIALYKQGADLGHAACQHNLACCYMNGDGLPEDHHAAFALMQKSAAQGYGLAMRDLGRCYQFANGCTGNMQTALEWYSKAAEVLHDPELERRVEAFRVLAKEDPHWNDDYPEDDGSA